MPVAQIKMVMVFAVCTGNQAAAYPSNGSSSSAMSSAASPTPMKIEEDEVDKESEREKEQDLLPAKKHDAKRSTLDHHMDVGSSHLNSVSTATASSLAANGTMQPEEVTGQLCLGMVTRFTFVALHFNSTSDTWLDWHTLTVLRSFCRLTVL